MFSSIYDNYNQDENIKNLLVYMKDKNQPVNQDQIITLFKDISLYKNYRGRSLLSHIIEKSSFDKLKIFLSQKEIRMRVYSISSEMNDFLKKIDKLSNGLSKKKHFLNILNIVKFQNTKNLYPLLFTTLDLQSKKSDTFYNDIISSLNEVDVNTVEFNKFPLEYRQDLLSAHIHYSDFNFWNNCQKNGLKLETEFLLTFFIDSAYKDTVLLFKNNNCDLLKIMETTYTYNGEYEIGTIETKIDFNLSGYLKNLTYKDKLEVDEIISGQPYYSQPFLHYKTGVRFSDIERNILFRRLENWKETIINKPSFSLNKDTLFSEYINAVNFLYSLDIYPYYAEYNKINKNLGYILDKAKNINLDIFLRNNEYQDHNSFLSELLIQDNKLLLVKALKHQILPNVYHNEIHSIFNIDVHKKISKWEDNDILWIFNELKNFGLHFSLSFEKRRHYEQLDFFDSNMKNILLQVFPEYKKEIYTYHLLNTLNERSFSLKEYRKNVEHLIMTEHDDCMNLEILNNFEIMINKKAIHLTVKSITDILDINRNIIISLSKNILSESITANESKKALRI